MDENAWIKEEYTIGERLANDINVNEVKNQYLHGRLSKIHAIKRIRELTGLGLRESKEYVETLAGKSDKPIEMRRLLHEYVDSLAPSQVLEVAKDLHIW